MNAMPEPIPFVPEGPQPLLRETPLGAEYPVASLGPLRSAAEAVRDSTGAPVGIPAQSALAVASLAVQGFANVETLGGPAPLSIFALTIAKSGERKTTCDRKLLTALSEHEHQREQDRRQDISAWRTSVDLYRIKREAILSDLKKAKGTSFDAKADLAALGAEPSAPPSECRTTTEPTFEGLVKLFIEGQPSLGLFSDEGGQFLGGHGMNSENKQKTLAAFNGLWDGSPIRRTRAGDGAITVYGRRLAGHLMFQPEVAASLMADALAGGIGFLPRCLICAPESTIGTRLSATIRPNPGPIEAFSRRLAEILARPMPLKDQETRELEPRLLPLNPAARRLLTEFSDHVEREQAPGGEFASVTGYASKAQEQAARLAGILTLWADLDAPEVTPGAMAQGVALADYYLVEATRLVEGANVPPAIAQAERLRKWLIDEWPEAEIVPREIMQLGPGRDIRNRNGAHAAITILQSAGWLEALDAGTVIRGRARREAYRIVRGEGHGF